MPEPERPETACLLHAAPSEGKEWVRADKGYRTCAACLDRLRTALREIEDMYRRLDAQPGNQPQGGRATPGFGSRPPANLNVIVMRDRRSLPYEAEGARDDVLYYWDPTADDILEPGQHGPPRGAYTTKRDVWTGRDGRHHAESPHALLSIPATLAGIAHGVADMREIAKPVGGVAELRRWLDNQLDWLTRQDWIPDPAAEIHRLRAQLHGIDEPRRKIGKCPNTVDEGETTRVCGAPLFAPVRGDAIHCRQCSRRWPRSEWLNLGNLLAA